MLRAPKTIVALAILAASLLISGPSAAAKLQRVTAPVGQAAGDEFGVSVHGVGDTNGDGFADWIVGAAGNSAAGTSAGRAYVFRGGTTPDSIADVTLTGQAAFDNFGRAASGAGDVNGDGYDDVICGARNNDTIRRDAGRAYVFHGGLAMNNVADWTLNGTIEAEQFGNSVDGAGDWNGDGFDDVIVGANRNDGGTGNLLDDRGRASVYFGGLSPDIFADWFVNGQASGDNLGQSVAGAGDVNGDGYADVIVGAPTNDAGGADAGRAYVYYGGVAADTIPDLVLTGDSAGDDFGVSVAGAGDQNGDGYADVIVGADLDDVGGVDAGRAYVFYGGPGADAVADRVITGAGAGDNLGRSVSGAGDLNADGFADVVVGALFHDGAGADAGIAYLVYGGPAQDSTPDAAFAGEAAGDELGIAVSGAGDVNGDGHPEIVVGAHFDGTAAFHAGRAYVLRATVPVSVPALPWPAAVALTLALAIVGVVAFPRAAGERPQSAQRKDRKRA